MALNKNDLAMVEKLIKMMKEHKVDLIEIGKVKIVKGYHEMSIPTDNKEPRSEEEITNDILFHSAT